MKKRIIAIAFAILTVGFWNQPSTQAASMYTLVVVYSSENAGQGTVNVDRGTLHPYGLEGVGPADCAGAVCGASFAAGTRVTLTATAAPGSVFMGWGGECSGTSPRCVVTMGGHRDVMVYFGR